MSASDDPLVRRRRAREARRIRLFVIGGVVAGVTAVVVPVVVAFIFYARQTGNLPFPVIDHARNELAVAGDARRLADHKWWKGEVTPAAVAALIDEIRSRGTGRGIRTCTIFYNQKGQFYVVEETTVRRKFYRRWVGDEVQFWADVGRHHPEVTATLGRDVRLIEVAKLSLDAEVNHDSAVADLEISLRHDSRAEELDRWHR